MWVAGLAPAAGLDWSGIGEADVASAQPARLVSDGGEFLPLWTAWVGLGGSGFAQPEFCVVEFRGVFGVMVMISEINLWERSARFSGEFRRLRLGCGWVLAGREQSESRDAVCGSLSSESGQCKSVLAVGISFRVGWALGWSAVIGRRFSRKLKRWSDVGTNDFHCSGMDRAVIRGKEVSGPCSVLGRTAARRSGLVVTCCCRSISRWASDSTPSICAILSLRMPYLARANPRSIRRSSLASRAERLVSAALKLRRSVEYCG